jgi:hypothetical protein
MASREIIYDLQDEFTEIIRKHKVKRNNMMLNFINHILKKEYTKFFKIKNIVIDELPKLKDIEEDIYEYFHDMPEFERIFEIKNIKKTLTASYKKPERYDTAKFIDRILSKIDYSFSEFSYTIERMKIKRILFSVKLKSSF